MKKKTLVYVFMILGIIPWLIPSAAFAETGMMVRILYYGFHVIVAVLFVIQLRMMIKNNTRTLYEWILIYSAMVGSVFIYALTNFILALNYQLMQVTFFPVLYAFRMIPVVTVIVARYIQDGDEKLTESKNRDLRKLEQEEIKKKKAEAREIRRNTPNYTKWFYRVLLKSFKYHIKDYSIFIFSAVLTVTYVYGFLGNLSIVNGMQEVRRNFPTEGITGAVLGALIMVTLVTMVIQFYALRSYMQNSIYDYNVLVMLGMRKKEITKMILILISASVLIAFIIGLILGSGMIFIFKSLYKSYLNIPDIPYTNTGLIIAITIGFCLFMFLLCVMMVQEMIINTNMMESISKPFNEEKLPEKIKPLLLISTLLVFIVPVFYANPIYSEDVFIKCIWIALFGIMFFSGAGFLLSYIKSKKKYDLDYVLKLNLILHKSKGYLLNTFVLYLLQFAMFFIFLFQISTLYPLNNEKEIYPYDYVVLGYSEDFDDMKSIGKKYDVDSEVYPVVRVTVPGGEQRGNGDWMKKIIPIGHHLGLSESTYEKITGNKIDLKGKQIEILFQEDKSDKAHPLDFSPDRSLPAIGIRPADWYDPGDRKALFPNDYEVLSQRREIVFGRLTSNMYENIVVFSDEHFDKNYDTSKGIRWIATVKGSGTGKSASDNKKLNSYLESYRKSHTKESSFDYSVSSVYNEKQLQQSFQAEKLLKLIVNISIFVAAAVASVLVIFIHMFGNTGYYKKRYDMLSYLGASNKTCNSLIKKEVRLFANVPFVLAIVTGLIFVGITVWMRGFNSLELISSAKIYLGVLAVYLLIYQIAVSIISNLLIKEIGGK